MSVTAWVCIFLSVSVLSLIVARMFAREVIGPDSGTPAMQQIAGAIKNSGAAFVKRPYKAVAALLVMLLPTLAYAQPDHTGGGEASLTLPDLSSVSFANFFGLNGHALLMIGLLFCAGGLLFGMAIYVQLKNMPVHRTMLEISDLIYETCKTYLVTQGKFILLLWAFIAVIISLYFGILAPVQGHPIAVTLPIILLFSLVGIAGSYGVAWFGIRVNTFANSRTAFAGLRGKPYPISEIPLKAGMSIGMLLISVELLIMLFILLFIPRDYAGPCFIGFAIGESLGAAALRIAGGIFTKIADIGADLMKIVFKIKEDDARNPGVIADCTGDNAGDSVGPSADGFETYGVTGVALITFILLAVKEPSTQAQLLVWIFVMRVAMLLSSSAAYFLNGAIARAKYANADEMDFEAPLTSLVWITSITSIILTYIVTYLMIPTLGDGTLWWKLASIISCGTLAGAVIPELVKVFTSTNSTHVKEVVKSAQEGGASLGILSGFVAGNFSAYWLGLSMVALMAMGYFFSTGPSMEAQMLAPAVFAFGLVAFGFLGMGPVTIAVDSYGPVTDNAQSVYELSLIEEVPGIEAELKKDFNIDVKFEQAKYLLEANDGAGNTFKATAKPVLIGTAVVGATTMTFSRGEGVGQRQQEGGGNLHQVRAEGNVQHLSGRILRYPCVRIHGTVLVYRLPILDCDLWPVPGHLHGQCRRRLGQRQEDRRGQHEREGNAFARRHGDRRHGRRSVQRHLIGGNEPDYQVHHLVRIACCRACRHAHCEQPDAHPRTGSRILPGVDVLRAEIILWHEN